MFVEENCSCLYKLDVILFNTWYICMHVRLVSIVHFTQSLRPSLSTYDHYVNQYLQYISLI